MAVTSVDMRNEGHRLTGEAKLLEGFAKERYEDSAFIYGGGSSAFVAAIDKADEYMKEAKALRVKAAEYYRAADWIYETEEKDNGTA